MPKNDTYDPIFIKLLIFHHGGHDLHDLDDLKVNKMKNLSSKLDSAHLK